MTTCAKTSFIISLLSMVATLGCAQTTSSIDLTNAVVLGSQKGSIEIIVFSDFQCGFCKRAASELNRLRRSRPGRYRIYFKHYPHERHAQALGAAYAAEAARLQGKFWEMHDLLFMRADELHDNIYEQLATELEIDLGQFKTDMSSEATVQHIAADKEEGDELGLDGTPYFLINRIPFRGSYADLAERVEPTSSLR
jgi:protein-disulfide isomerase